MCRAVSTAVHTAYSPHSEVMCHVVLQCARSVHLRSPPSEGRVCHIFWKFENFEISKLSTDFVLQNSTLGSFSL